MLIHATKKRIKKCNMYTSDLAAPKGFTALKAEVGKLDVVKLVNVLNSLNNLKIKIDNLDVAKLKTVHLVDKQVVKNTMFNIPRQK